jgi:predicted transglutaminase-like cysteine proteinase
VLSVSVCLLAAVRPAVAADQAAATAMPAFMRIFARTEPPAGYLGFCARQPSLCRQSSETANRVVLTEATLQDLTRINDVVNKTVAPVSDQELYGASELWTLPVDRGDCEDYALLKQKMLRERGMPAGALLMTVVRDEQGQGHAVLTVRTDRGDLILDNRYDEVKPWSKTPYAFVKRQSYLNPGIWMSLEPVERRAPVSLSSAQAH